MVLGRVTMNFRIDLLIAGAISSIVISTLLFGCGSAYNLLSPEPTIAPQMTSLQVIAAFDDAGTWTDHDINTMSGRDYDGAPQICPGQYFGFSTGGDVVDHALVLQCDTNSKLNQLSNYYQSRGKVMIRGGTMIVVSTYILAPRDLQNLDSLIRDCTEIKLCTGN